MTNKVDITNEILKIHSEETSRKFDELVQEYEHTNSSDMNQPYLLKLKGFLEESPSNVDELSLMRERKKSTVLVEEQLMAAAGQELGKWFSRPIQFLGAGLRLELSKLIGEDDLFNVYLHPISDAEQEKVQGLLEPYVGQKLKVQISIDGVPQFEADIKVHKRGILAEGSAKLLVNNKDLAPEGKGRISIDILNDE